MLCSLKFNHIYLFHISIMKNKYHFWNMIPHFLANIYLDHFHLNKYYLDTTYYSFHTNPFRIKFYWSLILDNREDQNNLLWTILNLNIVEPMWVESTHTILLFIFLYQYTSYFLLMHIDSIHDHKLKRIFYLFH